jgi:hypothetical protein
LFDILQSVVACIVMAATAVYTARIRRRYAEKAQQIVLAAAIFDKHGRVLVNPDGLLPSERITTSFPEKTQQDFFTEAHPLFHWMFQVSRNWQSITTLLPGINNHLSTLPHSGRGNSHGSIKLITDHGDVIEHHQAIFKEQFCVAAAALADNLKIQLNEAGVLWDEIVPTGSAINKPRTVSRSRQPADKSGRTASAAVAPGDLEAGNAQKEEVIGDSASVTALRPNASNGNNTSTAASSSDEDLAEKGFSSMAANRKSEDKASSRGSLMFLVRHVQTTRELQSLEAAGYRFAQMHQVCPIIASSMRVPTRRIELPLRRMVAQSHHDAELEPGVHMGLFAVRPRVAGGFDIMVRQGTHNLLPSVPVPLKQLDPWQIEVLRQLDGMSPNAVTRELENRVKVSPNPSKEKLFSTLMLDSIVALHARLGDAIFAESMLTSRVVDIPCRKSGAADGSTGNTTCTMIAFRAVIPIYSSSGPNSPNTDFIPLNFFKVQQQIHTSGNDAAYDLAFSRRVHRELAPIIYSVPTTTGQKPRTGSGSSKSGKGGSSGNEATPGRQDKNGSLVPGGGGGGFGSIMVSQEIHMQVGVANNDRASEDSIEMKALSGADHRAAGVGAQASTAAIDEMDAPWKFVDELFSLCVDDR